MDFSSSLEAEPTERRIDWICKLRGKKVARFLSWVTGRIKEIFIKVLKR